MPIETEIVAQDAMGKIEKTTLVLPGKVSEFDELMSSFTNRLPASDAIKQLKQYIADMFVRQGLPDPGQNVMHKGNGSNEFSRFWCYFTSENRPEIGAISNGFHYIEKSHKALSKEAVWARIYFQATRVEWAIRDKNLDELYYQCIRLGMSINQAQARSAFLPIIEKKIRHDESNRKHGKYGGQAHVKKERYEVLDRLAKEKQDRFQYASNREAIRTAKSLAIDYDRNALQPLFQISNELLSNRWFDEWWVHFRNQMRQSLDIK